MLSERVNDLPAFIFVVSGVLAIYFSINYILFKDKQKK